MHRLGQYKFKPPFWHPDIPRHGGHPCWFLNDGFVTVGANVANPPAARSYFPLLRMQEEECHAEVRFPLCWALVMGREDSFKLLNSSLKKWN